MAESSNCSAPSGLGTLVQNDSTLSSGRVNSPVLEALSSHLRKYPLSDSETPETRAARYDGVNFSQEEAARDNQSNFRNTAANVSINTEIEDLKEETRNPTGINHGYESIY